MAQIKGPAGVGELLTDLITRKQWRNRLHLHQVFTFWDDVVGDDIAHHAQPQVIRGTVLWVGVSDSMWMQQLQYERQCLLEALNARLDGVVGGEQSSRQLSELKLSLDPSLAQRQSVPQQPQVLSSPVDQRLLAEFTGLLDSITDQELKRSMVRVWLAMHRGGQGR